MNDEQKSGKIHVYHGPGKGKTTAALGAIVRATGAGLRVFAAFFLKRGEFSEINALKRLDPPVEVRQYGRTDFIVGPPTPEDYALARRGLEEVAAALTGGEYDLVVLDEAALAAAMNLISTEILLQALAARSPECEVILTGRDAPDELLAVADLITEMRAQRHYFDQGVPARHGIEY